jgi:guanosine-3',5'-bis(diphosphate) 3'-pyrophosphohydrolase
MSERLHRAIDLAARAHAGQFRKDKDMAIPYVAHVYGVAMLLANHGFSEDVVIAGLLHDVLEDSPAFSSDVAMFGDNVHRWVLTVTDPVKAPDDRRPWLERKAGYIEQIREGAPEAKAVACADKIHNMESTLLGLQRGDGSHLRRPLEVQVLYWRRVREAFGVWSHPMLASYEELLDRLAARAGRGD